MAPNGGSRLRLQDKVCIITGAGSGIGRASAMLFGDEGAHVVVSDIDGESAKETVALMKGRNVDAVASSTDVTDDRQAEALC